MELMIEELHGLMEGIHCMRHDPELYNNLAYRQLVRRFLTMANRIRHIATPARPICAAHAYTGLVHHPHRPASLI